MPEASVGYTLSVAHRIATVLLCILLAAAFSLHHSLNKLSALITYRLEQRTVQTLKTTVKNPAGDFVEVITENNGTETQAEQYARHMAMVNLVKAGG